MNTLKRSITWRPAFDKRDPNPSKNYGIHGLEIQFRLVGEDGGVTYTIFTNWMLPAVQAEMDSKSLDGRFPYMFHKPQTAGLNGHWKRQGYPEQSSIKDCKITGGDCYCDGTSLTDFVLTALISEGEEAVWKIMEERYESWRPKGEQE